MIIGYKEETGIVGCHGFGFVPDKNIGSYQTALGDYGIEIGKKPVPARGERKKDLDEIMEEALANAPSIEGYTIRPLSEVIDSPWSTTRWHLERLEARGIIDPYELGRAKIYALKRRKEKQLG